MLFTEGKDQVYERMMQQKPVLREQNAPKRKKTARHDCKPYNGAYRYQYTDLDCAFCSNYQKKCCPHATCPYITDNLDDLMKDPAFIAAMTDAKNCDTPHRNTLLSLYEKYYGVAAKH